MGSQWWPSLTCKVTLFTLLFNTDIEDPAIQCPSNQNVETIFNKATAVAVWTEPEASDNSGQRPNVSCSIESGSHFVIGKTEVTCQANDGFGNRAECRFSVEVKGRYVV